MLDEAKAIERPQAASLLDSEYLQSPDIVSSEIRPVFPRPAWDGHLREPLTRDPAVDHVKTGLWLVVGHHVTGSVDVDEGEVASALDRADLGSSLDLSDLGTFGRKSEVFKTSLLVCLLARPFEGIGPGKVAVSVANVVGVTLLIALTICYRTEGSEELTA